ncbi:hypothetical protein PVAP13_9KG244800 [Panicum virgatum]|uniref:RING-type domain-containing protein n=2 Tax=Panicum virgatum TaxID=38727 RepID=A0A8T0NL09_PANVG|nr:hypothetical protein PVAP13_9KG244800 [Panicum virgatum]
MLGSTLGHFVEHRSCLLVADVLAVFWDLFGATRVYCFVHQVPVCGECICFPEHQLCVVKNYAEWVVNSDYDWPQHCSSCNSVLKAGSEETTRLGCLHVMHTKCLISHIQSFPTQTAPAGYVCPSCSTPIWPPSSIKDTGSRLHAKLKEAIIQTGLEKNVFGNHFVTISKADTRTPPAFASDPLKHLSSSGDRESNGASIISSAQDASLPSTLHSAMYTSASLGSGTPIHIEPEIVEIEGPSPVITQFPEQESNFIRSPSPHGPGAMTRKGVTSVDRQNSEISYYADDEDGNRKKYTKRGTFRHRILRMLLPFWSSALPTLPVTAPSKKESDGPEGRPRQRSSRMDPTKILLAMAILACIATMGILYYRLSQRSLSESFVEDEIQ